MRPSFRPNLIVVASVHICATREIVKGPRPRKLPDPATKFTGGVFGAEGGHLFGWDMVAGHALRLL